MFRLSEHCASTISEQCFHWRFKSSVSLGQWLRKFRVAAVTLSSTIQLSVKQKSPRTLGNIRNCQSPNGTSTQPRSVHHQENYHENWKLHKWRQHLSLS